MYATRIERALRERIYLLRADKLHNQWSFEVKGQSNKVYKIKMTNGDKCTCSCMDFVLRKKLCKHLIFITERIAKLTEITYGLITTNHLNLSTFEQLSTVIEGKLLAHGKQENGMIEEEKRNATRKISETSEDCFICFESLSGETLVQCVTRCKNYFHEECLKIWLSKNNTCPLCRSEWVDPVTKRFKAGEDDALSFFHQTTLKPVLRLKPKSSGTPVPILLNE